MRLVAFLLALLASAARLCVDDCHLARNVCYGAGCGDLEHCVIGTCYASSSGPCHCTTPDGKRASLSYYEWDDDLFRWQD